MLLGQPNKGGAARGRFALHSMVRMRLKPARMRLKPVRMAARCGKAEGAAVYRNVATQQTPGNLATTSGGFQPFFLNGVTFYCCFYVCLSFTPEQHIKGRLHF